MAKRRNKDNSAFESLDEKEHYYREQLYREISHMFNWENLPLTIPVDYLERNLVRYGTVLYYEDEEIGQDVLRASVVGYNRHNFATSARTFSPNTENQKTQIERKIKRLTDSKTAIESFDPKVDGVLIQNMEYGQSVSQIVNFYASRLAVAQQAFDTNLLWSNMPYIFKTSNNEMKLSIERMFDDIFTGKPSIIVDKQMLQDNGELPGSLTGVPFIVKDLLDVLNEIKMQFKQTVGFDTAGVDKAERVNTLEIESNDQHTSSVLDIMLQQRKIAVENINAFFGTNIIVSSKGAESEGEEETEEEVEDESLEEGEIEDGADNSGIKESIKE